MTTHPERRPRLLQPYNRLCHFSVRRGKLWVRPTDIFYFPSEVGTLVEYHTPRAPSWSIGPGDSAVEMTAAEYAAAMNQPLGD